MKNDTKIPSAEIYMLINSCLYHQYIHTSRRSSFLWFKRSNTYTENEEEGRAFEPLLHKRRPKTGVYYYTLHMCAKDIWVS